MKKRKWRMLNVGDVRPKGYQFRQRGSRTWAGGYVPTIGVKIDFYDDKHNEYRAPVTNKYVANTSNLPKRHKLNPSITVIVDDVEPHAVEMAAQTIAGDAAARALSGREMSARQVWERMATDCWRRIDWSDGTVGCNTVAGDGPCHMGVCPRLRGA